MIDRGHVPRRRTGPRGGRKADELERDIHEVDAAVTRALAEDAADRALDAQWETRFDRYDRASRWVALALLVVLVIAGLAAKC